MQTAPPATRSVLPFIILIVVLTAGVTVAAKTLDRQIVIANWKERRCDLPIMIFAPLFRPDGEDTPAAEFAKSNFDFCMRRIQEDAIGETMRPIYSMFDAQRAASDTVAGSLNNLRNLMTNTTTSTTNLLLGTFYNEFKRLTAAVSLTAQRIRMAMNRISASTQAMLYMAISTVRAILNAIDFILLVALIIVTILAIIFIILFFVLFPSVPLILAVLSLLVGAGVAVGDLRDTFCFAPHTLVRLADGTVRPIAGLQVGTALAGGGTVTGMYKFNGTQSQLYDLRGVHVAGDHMVWDDAGGRWCYVKDHPDAKQTTSLYMNVYCPVVDTRRLSIVSMRGDVTFRDWEEVETDAEVSAWLRWAWSALNPSRPFEEMTREGSVLGFEGSTSIFVSNRGAIVPIKAVKIGDYIVDQGGKYTRVIGLYEGIVTGDRTSNWIWDAVDGTWQHEYAQVVTGVQCYHLVTESGTFMIDGKLVRDATEVGNGQIGESYSTIINVISGGRP